jgi:hypothetical protein
VANFITQLKHSGYFDKVEITEAKEDDIVKGTATFGFKMTAAIGSGSPAPATQPKTQPAGGAAPPTNPPRGRS